ncbi:MAG: FadR family transcriptional regulator [Spirochaetales bacterium]|nr:FadR family transcriptional regulator [Spirochaetales bacterium]
MELHKVECPEQLERRDLKTDVVVMQLKKYIIDNELTAGAQLPTEAELSSALHVSRPAIREAMKALESLGLIMTVQGKGRFIREFNYRELIDAMTYNVQVGFKDFQEVLQVRKALEYYFINEAMQKLTESDYRELEQVVDKMEAEVKAGKSYNDIAETHARFHQIIFRSVGNKLLDALISMFAFFQKMLDKTVDDKVLFIQEHRSMIDSLRSGDVDGMREKISRHFHDFA